MQQNHVTKENNYLLLFYSKTRVQNVFEGSIKLKKKFDVTSVILLVFTVQLEHLVHA